MLPDDGDAMGSLLLSCPSLLDEVVAGVVPLLCGEHRPCTTLEVGSIDVASDEHEGAETLLLSQPREDLLAEDTLSSPQAARSGVVRSSVQ